VCPQSYNAEGVSIGMGEEEAEEIAEALMSLLTAIDNRMELHWRVQERIADTLERLLKFIEMRP